MPFNVKLQYWKSNTTVFNREAGGVQGPGTGKHHRVFNRESGEYRGDRAERERTERKVSVT